jgi:hypothetical protein
MAIQNVIGDSFRGATWVSIHNGGGVGWGEVINGGFGMVLDGSKRSVKAFTIHAFGMSIMGFLGEAGLVTKELYLQLKSNGSRTLIKGHYSYYRSR